MAEFAWQHMFSGWRQILEVTLTSTRSADGTDRAVNLRLFDMLSHEVCVWHQLEKGEKGGGGVGFPQRMRTSHVQNSIVQRH